jgi:uncharacterized protein YndB with AHSA1/START domain
MSSGSLEGRFLEVSASGTTVAAPEIVWPLIEDANRYREWGPWNDSRYVRPGDASPHGPGAIRRIRYGRMTTTTERVLDVEPGRRVVYEVVSGIPVKNYRAVVELRPTPNGTAIHWSARFDRTLGGRLVHRKLRDLYPIIVDQLVAAADAAATSRSTH